MMKGKGRRKRGGWRKRVKKLATEFDHHYPAVSHF